MTVITKENYEKFEADFENRKNTTRVCSECGKDRLYGHGCAHCGKMVMSMLEFGDAMKISFEAMTPEERMAFQQTCRDDRLKRMPSSDSIN